MMEKEDDEVAEDMFEFLRKQGVDPSQLQNMRFNGITPKLLKDMKEEDLKEFLPKYAHRVAVRDYVSLKYRSRRKEKLIRDLQQKMRKFGSEDNNACKSKKQRLERQILLGWVMCWDGERSKQVKESLGGGIRKIYVPINAGKSFILQKAIGLFFPNGKCKNLNIDDYDVDLLNSHHETVDDVATVDSILKATALQKLRLYLSTKPKQNSPATTPNTEHLNSTVTLDDNHELISHMNSRRSRNSVTSTVTSENCADASADDFELNIRSDDFHLDAFDVTDKEPTCPTDITDLNTEYTLLINSILDGCDDNGQASSQPTNSTCVVIKNAPTYPDLADCQYIPQTFEEVLRILQKSVDPETSSTFNVFRDEIFACCVRAMRRPTFSPYKKIFVKFSDIEGLSEGAIDDGGPTRELFRLVLTYIKDSSMFVGNRKKHLSLNSVALENKHYFEAGRIIALSLIHGGPAPHFFSDFLFSLIIGDDNTNPTFEDVEEDVKSTLMQLKNCGCLSDAQNIVTENNIFSTAGYHFIFKIEEMPNILQGTLKFFSVTRIRDALFQFMEGLKTCNVYEYLTKYPHLFKSHMCDDTIAITAEDLNNIFEVSYSAIGSNTRKVENKVITYFRDYLLDCEASNSLDIDATCSHGKVSVTDVLVFATGADQIPPLGFRTKPQIEFLHDDPSIYPKANTCSLMLKLPVVHTQYEEFTNALNFAIANCNSFGFA